MRTALTVAARYLVYVVNNFVGHFWSNITLTVVGCREIVDVVYAVSIIIQQ